METLPEVVAKSHSWICWVWPKTLLESPRKWAGHSSAAGLEIRWLCQCKSSCWRIKGGN